MNQKVLKTLEYNKIIHQLTGYAASAPGKLLCQNLLPMSDFHEIVQAQTETSDALTRVRMKGSLSLSGIRDVRDSLKRLEIGSALGIPGCYPSALCSPWRPAPKPTAIMRNPKNFRMTPWIRCSAAWSR